MGVCVGGCCEERREGDLGEVEGAFAVGFGRDVSFSSTRILVCTYGGGI